MIRFQIIELQENLYKTLIEAMRSGELRTFSVSKRGRKVTHRNPNYHGWINWSYHEGVIAGEVLSPHKPGSEWKLLSALIGRLTDRYAERIHSINIQFFA
jgi:hypothetical protein